MSARSVPADIDFLYADTARPHTVVRLARLLRRRDVDVFCLDQTEATGPDAGPLAAQQRALLGEFLPTYFPFRAPWELPDEVAQERARLGASELFALGGQPKLPGARPTLDLAPSGRGVVANAPTPSG